MIGESSPRDSGRPSADDAGGAGRADGPVVPTGPGDVDGAGRAHGPAEVAGAGHKRSGLRSPAAAVRAVGAGALAAEGLVLLLAVEPMWVLTGAGTGIAAVLALAATCFGLAALVRRTWAWYAATAVPAALVVCGFLVHPSLAVLGVLFGLLWAYVLHVRRSVLR